MDYVAPISFNNGPLFISMSHIIRHLHSSFTSASHSFIYTSLQEPETAVCRDSHPNINVHLSILFINAVMVQHPTILTFLSYFPYFKFSLCSTVPVLFHSLLFSLNLCFSHLHLHLSLFASPAIASYIYSSSKNCPNVWTLCINVLIS